MKKTILVLVLCGLYSFLRAQQSITFTIEKLSKPEHLLHTSPQDQIYRNLIDESAKAQYMSYKDTLLPSGILATNPSSGPLVNFGFHSFFQGIRAAYAEHRPFVISPDMLWLLISQGFACHLQQHAEELRDCFVAHSGKVSLIIRNDQLSFDMPGAPWEQVFPLFTDQMRTYLKSDVIDLLTADFSTTTPVARIASQITAMKAMEAYFEYFTVIAVCGIPEITLLGTPEDWQRVLDKTRRLGKYRLEWWTDELEPILAKIIETAAGKPDIEFWSHIFKQHTSGGCGKNAAPFEMFYDGWIVKFFPYDAKGERLRLQRIDMETKLPDEIVKVDVQGVKQLSEGNFETVPLEFWAGFIGLGQDSATYALTPQIGWMVRKKNTANEIQHLIQDKEEGHVALLATEVPPGLLQLNTISILEIEFTDRILIPDELAKVKIGTMYLKGKIDKQETERLKTLFPNTYIKINHKKSYYYRGGTISPKIYRRIPQNLFPGL